MKASAASTFSYCGNSAAAYISAPVRNIMDTAPAAVSIAVIPLLIALRT